MIQTKRDIKISGKISNQDYFDILFDGLIVRKANISKSRFSNIHFKNSQLGFASKYNDCEFNKCKFYGKYSTLGLSSKFVYCKFIDCEFIGNTLFEDSRFIFCCFKGKIKNAIIRSGRKRLFQKRTVFDHCDLSNLVFENSNFYGKNCFYESILPIKGLRKYNNENDSLLERAEEVLSKIDTPNKIDSEIIFKRDLKSGQNPIILDEVFLNSFFKTNESRQLFDSITDGFEYYKNKEE